MKNNKGAGLLIAVIIAAFVVVILFVVLRRPSTVEAPIEGVDPDRSILEQSTDIVDQARDVRDVIEQRGDVEELLVE